MSGLFETIRVRGGRAPFLPQHLARLTASAQALGRPGPEPGFADRILARGGDGDMVVRATLSERGERIEPRAVPPDAPMRIVFSGTRHEPYPHKTTDRETFDRARSRVVPYRADEVILLTGEGVLAEGCVTNLFFWLGSELCTPSLDLGILPGIGRARVLEIAAARGIAVKEGHVRRAEVEGLPLFLVNAVRGIVETTQHGRSGEVGDDRTRPLAQAFWG